MRAANAHPVKFRGGATGYRHVLDGSQRPTIQPRDTRPPELPPAELESLARRWASDINPERLARFAANMGLSVGSLHALRIGRNVDRNVWTFPMVDVAGRVTGIRLRTDSGKKFSVEGGHEGLFIPTSIDPAGTLVICEGPTDTAAALDLGLNAVGRPSCSSGVDLLLSFIDSSRYTRVVIFSQRDEAKRRPDGSVYYPAQDGAEVLTNALDSKLVLVSIVMPPAGVKDIRAWRTRGATVADATTLVAGKPISREFSPQKGVA